MVLSLRLVLQAGLACGVCLAAADVPPNATPNPIGNPALDRRIPDFTISAKHFTEDAKLKALTSALAQEAPKGFPNNVPSSILGATPTTKSNECAIPLTEVKSPGNVEFSPDKPKPFAKGKQPEIIHNFDQIGVKPTAPSCSELRAAAPPDAKQKQR